jgi:protein TonB
MEAKKNSRADINSHRPKFFLIGLMLSISLVITAFEWRTKKSEVIIRQFDPGLESLAIIPITSIDPPKPVTPPSPVQQKTTSSTFPSIIVSSKADDQAPDVPTFDLGESGSNQPIVIEPNIEVDTTGFVVIAEHQPEPIGGFANFYKIVSENIKYPRQARNIATEGKVFVEFIVDRKGNATKLKIARGIGAGCDEEAMRVVALPKWQPGKQRGRAVNVKMIVPVHFQLRN